MLKSVALTRAPNELIERYLRAAASPEKMLRILEAGCGRRWPFQLDGLRYELTGVDADPDALRARRGGLDHAILGDLRHVDLPAARYDVIYCSFVLEHVNGAQRVLENFLRWLKPGGLLVLTFPDRDAVYGFVTRMTPFWVHVLYKKYLMGAANAGKPGYGPYPTHHDRIISRPSLHRFLTANGLVVLEERGFGKLPRWQRLFTEIVGAVSMRRLASGHLNLVYVLQRPSPGRPRAEPSTSP